VQACQRACCWRRSWRTRDAIRTQRGCTRKQARGVGWGGGGAREQAGLAEDVELMESTWCKGGHLERGKALGVECGSAPGVWVST